MIDFLADSNKRDNSSNVIHRACSLILISAEVLRADLLCYTVGLINDLIYEKENNSNIQ